MGDVVNLRQARKRRDRDEKAAQANRNRVLHGRSKAERAHSEAEARLDAARLDGHLRERPDTDDGR